MINIISSFWNICEDQNILLSSFISAYDFQLNISLDLLNNQISLKILKEIFLSQMACYHNKCCSLGAHYKWDVSKISTDKQI